MFINRPLLTLMLALLGAVHAVMAFPIVETELPLNCADRAAANRDKTGTNADAENSTGSQVVGIQPLASRVSFKAEGKGFEPSTGFPAPDFESERELRNCRRIR
jgi:hypothetical protein